MLARRLFSLSRPIAARSFATSLKDISIKGFFAASNYAIVGASTKPGTFGHIICENYQRTFKGETFYVNPKGFLVLVSLCIGGELFGKPIYKSPLDIPTSIEAAVIVVSVKYALQSAEECMKKGAKYVIVIPGGFKETKTEEGRKKQVSFSLSSHVGATCQFGTSLWLSCARSQLYGSVRSEPDRHSFCRKRKVAVVPQHNM